MTSDGLGAQFKALDFAGRGFGEVWDEFDHSRAFVTGETLPHEAAQFVR
jgi:hypothetical protein